MCGRTCIRSDVAPKLLHSQMLRCSTPPRAHRSLRVWDSLIACRCLWWAILDLRQRELPRGRCGSYTARHGCSVPGPGSDRRDGPRLPTAPAPSPRQLEVLRARCETGSRKEADACLGISPETMRWHLARLFERCRYLDEAQAGWRHREELTAHADAARVLRPRRVPGAGRAGRGQAPRPHGARPGRGVRRVRRRAGRLPARSTSAGATAPSRTGEGAT